MADGVTLARVTDPRQLDGVLAVDAESFSHPWTRRMYEDELATPHAQIWLALAGGATVGYCALWILAGELHINNVAVRRIWRRQGVAERLVRHAFDLARAAGAGASLLEVRRGNVGAIRLYERLGFREVGCRRGYYTDPPDDALLMTAPIQSVGRPSDA